MHFWCHNGLILGNNRSVGTSNLQGFTMSLCQMYIQNHIVDGQWHKTMCFDFKDIQDDLKSYGVVQHEKAM